MGAINFHYAIRYAVMLVLFACISLPAHGQTGVLVDELLTKLQQTLVTVRDAVNRENLPTLSKATLNLKSAFKMDGNGKTNLGVIEFGTEIASESVMEIGLELRPPEPSDLSPVSSSANQLADAIIESLIAVQKAKNREPPLHLSKLTALVRFSVQSQTGGGIDLKILPINISGDVGDNQIHQITVEFEVAP